MMDNVQEVVIVVHGLDQQDEKSEHQIPLRMMIPQQVLLQAKKKTEYYPSNTV
jgi:hypothetical protein